MKRYIVVSVGTSLISNCERSLGKKGVGEKELLQQLKVNPREAAAEANSLERLSLEPSDHLVFLTTDTVKGRLAGKVLSFYYESKVEKSESLSSDLTADSGDMKRGGLLSLAARVSELTRLAKNDGFDVSYVMTGGFKPQVATVAVVASVLAIPVYYIHEEQRDLVLVPPLPITWDKEFFREHQSILDELSETPMDRKTWESYMAGYPQEIRAKLGYMVEMVDDIVDLSPLVREAFDLWEIQEAQVSPSRKVFFSKTAEKQWNAMLDKVTKSFWTDIIERVARFDGLRLGESKHNIDLLFAPKGHQTNRIGFYKESDAIVICELFASHDDYDMALKARAMNKQNYEKGREFGPADRIS